ncbi:hypothetical protein BR93DRAFT_974466 [Coniochaeta sp. PMI_546]|nr:hypothetical protein BR93DRAFT_974466 [Coniochaeta sp. PMI_546]
MKPLRLAILLTSTTSTHAHGLFGRTAKVTASPVLKHANSTLVVEKRIVTEMSTCGYLNGDPSLPRTANTGFNCRVDTSHGLWGFCPTTVISAVDCGLGGACIDSYACSKGCGYTNNPSMTTWTCSESTEAFCSTALLTFGIDQTYSYIGCGGAAKTDHYFVSPTAAATSSTSSAPSVRSSQTPAPTPSSTSTTSPSSSASSPPIGSTSMSPSSSSTNATVAPAETTGVPGANSSSANTNTDNNSTNSTGPIIGGVIGGLVVVCATVVLTIYLVKRDRSRRRVSDLGRRHAAVLPPEYSPKEPKTSRYSGWGPRELPACHPVEQVRSPVELPGYAL